MKPRLVTGASAPESRPALSPARQTLAELIDQRAGHERKIKELGAATDRLADVLAAREHAAAEIREFDKQSEDAILEWSKQHLKPTATAPVVDSDRRLSLLTKLAAAQENSLS